MDQTIVMVVHGIGEQRPGDTIDNLVGAATERLGLHGRVSGHTELLVHSPAPDDQGQPPPERLMPLFPCAIRRTVIEPGKSRQHRCIRSQQDILAAEVYWADLSAAPRGSFSILQDLLHTVLALGYLAIDNVEYATRARSAFAAALVKIFVWVFYTAIAPCNALMLAGAITLLAVDLALPADYRSLTVGLLIALALWALATAIGVWQARRNLRDKGSDLAWHFWFGTAIIGGGLVIWTIGSVLVLWSSQPTARAVMLFDSIADFLVALMVIAWSVSLCLLTVMVVHAVACWFIDHGRSASGLHGVLQRWRAGQALGISNWLRDKQTIYIPTCSALLILWTVLSASFWTAFSGTAVAMLGTRVSGGLFQQTYAAKLSQTTATLTAILIGVALLVFAGIAVSVLRHLLRDNLSQSTEAGIADIWLGRMIVNPVLSGLLFVLVFWVGLSALEALDAILSRQDQNGRGETALMIAGILGTLILSFRHRLSAGLGVVRDVTSYSIRTHKRRGPPHYPVRRQMLRRFDLVLDYLQGQMPDAGRLIVISHSQGTMIATTALARRADLPPEVRLVTMGSPLGHIYQQYFPAGFDVADLPGRLTRWLNIYRCDDFVGTAILDPQGRIDNQPVASGGHLNYWIDHQVWDIALQDLEACPLPSNKAASASA